MKPFRLLPNRAFRVAAMALVVGTGAGLATSLAVAAVATAYGEDNVEGRVADHAAHGELVTRIAPTTTGFDGTAGAYAADDDDDDVPVFDPDWPEPRRDCINIRLLRDFTVIDESHAIFFESARRPYLVTFAGFCPELDFAFRIVTASRTGRLCGFAGERIFVRNFRCFVRSIERVANADQARYLVATRTKDRDDDDTGDDTGDDTRDDEGGEPEL